MKAGYLPFFMLWFPSAALGDDTVSMLKRLLALQQAEIHHLRDALKEQGEKQAAENGRLNELIQERKQETDRLDAPFVRKSFSSWSGNALLSRLFSRDLLGGWKDGA